ncbi:MAG: thiosulfate oxidation carrier protein SoxY [Methylococcales bacterium]|nr:thiosulfate oxidation carrier protein SoxY [Methylococcales bacterium]MBT7444117.1 thiosulfate oxidation carrier protein SoxY [Methylococcales bacterium]
MNMNRRFFMKTLAVTSALLASAQSFAAWPKAAFAAKTKDDAIATAIGSTPIDAGDKIKIKAPPIAENGQVVPVTITSTLDNVTNITIFAADNPNPLSATFTLTEHVDAKITTKIKMAKTSDIIAVVKANGVDYIASKNVKVTKGGCGG